MKLACDEDCVRCGCVTLGALYNTAVVSPQKSNAVPVDTMAALFYRVTLCVLALFSLEVKGR